MPDLDGEQSSVLLPLDNGDLVHIIVGVQDAVEEVFVGGLKRTSKNRDQQRRQVSRKERKSTYRRRGEPAEEVDSGHHKGVAGDESGP